MAVSGRILDKISIDTPVGIRLELPICNAVFENDFTECSVDKDGGVIEDVTTGLKIFARAKLTTDGCIEVIAGEGIGKVTLPGLKVKVGNPAINPVPMKMIKEAVSSVLPNDKGVVLILRVPGGEEIAKRTYNPRLGIIGGISIIGTKGIVEPMSEEAWKEALALELSVLANKGFKSCVFVFGNYGEDFAVNDLKIPKEMIIKISNLSASCLIKLQNMLLKVFC